MRLDVLAAMVAVAGVATVLDYGLAVGLAGGLTGSLLGVAINLGAGRVAQSWTRGRAAAAMAGGASLAVALGGAIWIATQVHRWPLGGWGDPRVVSVLLLAAVPMLLVAGLRCAPAPPRHGEPIGWADVVLLGAIGLWFGIAGMWVAVALGVGSGALAGLIRQRIGNRQENAEWVPTVPWLAFGAVLMSVGAKGG